MSFFYQHQVNMQMRVVCQRENDVAKTSRPYGESGFRTAGAGLVLKRFCCFDAECGSCEISDLRLLLVLVLVV